MKSFCSALVLVLAFSGVYANTGILPFPEDTIAYNDLFNNRQWVQFDSQGNIHVSYTGQVGTNSNTREIYYVTDASGEFVTTQITNTTVDSNYSVFAVDDDDNLHLMYIERDGNNNFQVLYVNNTGGTFSTPVQITTGSNKGPGYIAWSSDNVVHFVFHTFINGAPDYGYYKTYNLNTQTLSSEVQLALSDAGSEHDVRVVTDSNNHAHVILRSGSLWGGLLKYYNNTSGTMQEYTIPVSGNVEYPAMVMDPGNRVHIIYRESSSKRIFYLVRDEEGNFSTPVAATPPGIGNPAFYRTIDLDDEGRLYFTYQNSISTAPVGFFLVVGQDGVFDDPVLVWNDPESLYVLRNSNSVAARGDGEVAVLYAPSAIREGQVVCDIFMKRGNINEEPQALISVDPTAMDFGDVAIDGYYEQTLTISNTGTAVLSFGLSFSDEFFYSPTDGPVSVDPQSSIGIPIVFQPTVYGSYSAELTITSNAANEPELIVPLSGNVPQTYSLAFVVNDENAIPVEDAVITLNGEEYPAGTYLFEQLLPGEYPYMVERAGFHPASGVVEIENENVTVTITLQFLRYRVDFDVVDAEGETVDDAVVTFDGIENEPGDYAFEDILPGIYSFSITAAGYFDYTGEVVVTDQDVHYVAVLQEDDTFVDGIDGQDFRLYPNPAVARFTVEAPFEMSMVVVYDASGRVVARILPESTRVEIATDNLEKGFYTVAVYSGEKRVGVKKLLVAPANR